MDTATLLAGGLVVVSLTAAAGTLTARLTTTQGPTANDYLRELEAGEQDGDELDEYSAKLRDVPMAQRILGPITDRLGSGIQGVTPRGHLDKLHAKILQGGLANTIRAEEFATLEVVSLVGLSLMGVVLTVVLRPSSTVAVSLLIGFPLFGLLGPTAWLNRKVTERKDALKSALPDVLDLLAISVEAGTGFEGAISVVCRNFDNAMSNELKRMLKEMELGLSRREALQNLKRRTEVPELSNFVLALVQADALGMPIGRVLKTQAVEMRNKRKAWAREKAAKLPVKIMIPLVIFIFPAILVVTMGPAMSTLIGNFK